MTKFEFLGDLSRLIADLPEDEREQAMEYYEDYFADAGPENEQEVIKEFISPSYIAEQLREASARRQQTMQAAPQQAMPQQNAQTAPQQAMPQQNVQAAPQQAMPQQSMQAAPQQAMPQQTIQAAPQQAMPQQTMQAAPQQAAGIPAAESPAPAAAEGQQDAPSMRNPIFQQELGNSTKDEEMLALRKKTKVDIKSINANTSKMDKKALAAAKQRSEEEKQYEASLYSSQKKTVIAVILLITCPISLSVLGLILGLFVLAVCAVIGCVLLGIGSCVASIASLLICILSLLTAHIPNSIFTLGTTLLLFSAGIGICFAAFKLATRAIPSAYYSLMVLFNNIKAALARFAMK